MFESQIHSDRVLRAEIASYMEQAFLFEFDADITDSTDLFRAGVMDSFGYIRLIQFLQNSYQIRFSQVELLTDLATSLSAMVTAVQGKLRTKSVEALVASSSAA